jgi:YbgC/YbaW family acyl-CoA thioester hydrolase
MWGDLDALGIVFYPRYYEWIDASGHLFFEAFNLNLGALWQQRGILFGLVETGCRYHKPGRYHQRIQIVTGIDDLTLKTVTLKHRIVTAAENELLVEGMEKRICLDVSDPQSFTACEFPADVFALLQRVYSEPTQ